MRLCYSGRSAPSAQAIADEDDEIFTVRGNDGDVNWGRARANTSLNPSISNVTNKRLMRQLFARHGVPMPTLYPFLLNIFESVPDSMELDGPVVGRPDTHTRGRGFWKCNTVGDVRKALRGTRKKRPATHFMDFIDAPHEVRVHIFNGKSIRISEKLHGSTGDTAHGNYTTIKPTVSVDKARDAAKKAVKAVGLDFGAVDILVMDDGTPYVLEVNSAPGLGGSMPALYARVFKDWYEHQR